MTTISQDLRRSSQRDKSLKSESLEVGKGGLPPLTLGYVTRSRQETLMRCADPNHAVALAAEVFALVA